MVRTAVAANYNVGMVLMVSALGPVVMKDHFSNQRRPREENRRKRSLFTRGPDKDVGKEGFFEQEKRTIDLFA